MSAAQNLQFLGITRWSYPGQSKEFRRDSADLADLRAQLYAPHRLDHRLFLLEHHLLPALKAQSDQDFGQLFVLGDQLPDPWRQRFLDLVAPLPQAIVTFEPEGQDMREMLADLIPQHMQAGADVVAQFRIDDDDAVSIDFIAESRAMFARLQPFFEQEGRMALDYTRGFILSSSAIGIDLRPVSTRFWAPGLVVFQERAEANSVFEFPHLRVWHEMPTLTWKERPMFIRGSHHDNDSGLGDFAPRTKSFGFRPANLRRYMQRRFGIDIRELRSKWTDQQAHFLGKPAKTTAKAAQ
jgi:hypothetical protein